MNKPIAEAFEAEWNKLSEEEKGRTDFDEFALQWVEENVEKGLPEISESYRQASIESENLRDDFSLNVSSKWNASYRELSTLVEYCSQIGEQFFTSEKLTGLEYVLRRGHARACMISKEILLLLKNAYPDGALARWRAMYEISVTLAFIARHGEACATRYIEFLQIDMLKTMRAKNNCAEKLGHKKIPDEDITRQEAIQKKLVEKYGKDFKGDYGWARSFLDGKKANLTNIAEDAQFGHWFVYYKLSSHSVHSSYLSLLSANATGNFNDEIMLAGQSERELFTPAQLLAITFTQLTMRVLVTRPDSEIALDMEAMGRMMKSTVQSLYAELGGGEEVSPQKSESTNRQ